MEMVRYFWNTTTNPEADPGEAAFTTQKIDTDSDTSFEESPQSQQEDPLYRALLECGTDPEKSKILADNYLLRYSKPLRHSINSVVSGY